MDFPIEFNFGLQTAIKMKKNRDFQNYLPVVTFQALADGVAIEMAACLHLDLVRAD